ncbi:MAG: diguanylate cyclase [Betaproteobacteria bacterium]|nr:diguanylate cyclase [Betaproteobacteria bacterium]
MDMLNLIETQMIANRLPLMAVTLAAVPHVNTPVVLTLHWHGFVEVSLFEGSQAVAYMPVPSSALQVNSRWDRFDDLENEALETAWELGAWDLERLEAKPFGRVGADAYEAVMGMHAFGAPAVTIDGDSPFVAEVPDADELVDAAGRAGYIKWLFRPVRGGVCSDKIDDVTLEAGGYRNPACPIISKPVMRPSSLQSSRRVIYSLGQGRGLDVGY